MTTNHNKTKIADHEANFISAMAERVCNEPDDAYQSKVDTAMIKQDAHEHAHDITEIEMPAETRFIINKMNAQGEITSQQFDHNEFAKWVLQDSGRYFASIAGLSNPSDSLLMYDSGIYKRGGYEWIIKQMEYIMDGHLCTTRSRSEVIGHVRANTPTTSDDFDTDDDTINMKNGLYSISGGALRPHDPTYLSVRQNGITYDPDATCPTIDKFFHEVMEATRVEAGYEMMGYSLLPRKRMKTATILLGPPNSGKGTYMRLLAEFVGHDSIAEVNISTVGEYAHSTESIIGKSVLRVDDLGAAPITDTGLLKSIISSERVHVNPKGGIQYDTEINSFLIVGCNQLPKCDDDAMMSKFDLFMFHLGRDNAECNVDLDKELCTELSGLFNRAMPAGKRAASNNAFTGTQTLKERSKQYLYKSLSHAEFVDTELDLGDPSAEIEIKVVRQMFIMWCKDMGKRVTSQKHTTTYLEEKGVMARRLGSRGEQVSVYVGATAKCFTGDSCHDNKRTQSTIGDDVDRTDVVRNAIMEILSGNHTDAGARVQHISEKTGISRPDIHQILLSSDEFVKTNDGDWKIGA